MTRFTHRPHKGFTLIELLVVVSIITLLISILLPAVGETRRQARISLCASNMKQHGQGISTYASQNNDNLAHAPNSNARTPGDVAIMGPRGAVAFRFANQIAPLNGFSFVNPGATTFTSPSNVGGVLNDSQFWNNLQGWNGYFIFLGEYMVDGEGVQALNDVFTSPSDTASRVNSWPRIRKVMRENFNGQWWRLDTQSQQAPLNNPVCGSYRYVPAAMTSYRIYSVGPDGTPLTPDYNINGGGASGAPFMTPDQKLKYVVRNPVATRDYPSNKVLFWMWYAWHNPKMTIWCQDGAVTPVAMGDGSARVVRPFQDGLPFIGPGDRKRYENAGPAMRVIYNPTQEAWDCHFLMTNGGIKGRDL